ncbi:HAD family phosphatase [bacterium]|nr:HAD family phosphatase [bacterium]
MSVLHNIDTILFDFDGVVIQSIEDHYKSWNQAFARFGVTVQWNDFAVLEGQSLYTIASQLCKLYNISQAEHRAIGVEKNALYLTTATIRFYDDIFPALEYLRLQKKSIGLVTGAHRDRFDQTVGMDFKNKFDVIITADDVTRTKPDPEPYLLAATKLNKLPASCLVIENAPLGIEAAKNAGMLCFALTTTLPAEFLSKADWIGKSVTDVIQLIKKCQ